MAGVLEVKVTEDFSCDFIVWQHEVGFPIFSAENGKRDTHTDRRIGVGGAIHNRAAGVFPPSSSASIDCLRNTSER